MSDYDQGARGAKTGSGPMAGRDREAIDRRERLRKLAMETIDLAKDPYILRNHVGTYECKLCLTLHGNEGNYLAHTQGKKHQQNLARRAAKEAKEQGISVPMLASTPRVPMYRTQRIGRPGYKVTKQKDPDTNQKSLLFQVELPEIDHNVVPRHRFMSAYEQRVEPVDKNYQYLLVAADPYETIAFKFPSLEIEKGPDRFYVGWDRAKKVYTMQIVFREKSRMEAPAAPPQLPFAPLTQF